MTQTLYAVFHEGQQITNPMSYEHAQAHASGLTAEQRALYEVCIASRIVIPGGESGITADIAGHFKRGK